MTLVSHRAPPTAWLIALVPVMFSYTGWNAAVYVAEEVRNPTRNVPLALAFGTASVIVLYLALNALYLRVVPREELLGAIAVGELAAARLFGSAAAAMFAGMAILIILSSLSAWTLAGPRIYFAMARDGVFFASAARVHPHYRTPAIAILAQTVWSTVLVLSGTFEQLLTYTGFYGDPVLSAGGAVVVLRADSRERHRYVPGVGLSVGAGDFLRRELCDCHQHHRQRPGAGLRRPWRDGGRRADLLVDGKRAKAKGRTEI